MLRMTLIFITIFTFLSLAACSQGESESKQKTVSNDVEPSKHEESDNHEDGEHHDSKKEAGHDDNESHKDTEHHDEGAEKGGHEEGGTTQLKPAQMQAAGIIVEPLVLSEVSTIIRAPGEVKLNSYRTIKVSPRINAQVIKRHARLGEEVSEGQNLVTLSSVEMADAQGKLLLADKEWKRVKKLGRKVISGRRYSTAKVDYEKSYAKARAFGMNKADIKALLKQKRSADGSFTLAAQQAGRVLHDKFIVGERVEAGYELMVIADESTMWVQARMTPGLVGQIDVGNTAEILLESQRLPAKVIQLHHTLDETTRTSAVRLEVANENDRLHAGMFVTTLVTSRNKNKALQVPEAAVLRSADGDWQVMVEQDEAGEFKAVEVKVKNISDGKAVIEGLGNNIIRPGTRVVTQGAFFVQSELAKGGFEIHNH